MPASDAPVSSATAPPAQLLLEAVLDRWQRPLYTFVCAIVNEDEVARDLVQDTFVAAWRAALRGTAPFATDTVPSAAAADDIRRWLYHAAYNRAISTWRRGRLIRWRSLDRVTPFTASLAASSVSLEERVAEEQAMSQALATLSLPDRACLLLIAVHAFTAAEVGAIVGASAPAITKRYARQAAPARRLTGAESATRLRDREATHMTSQPRTAPIPATCTPFMALLPLASAHLLDIEQQARLRTHLATCARCQAELALQEHLDSSLLRLQAAHRQSMVPLVAQQITRGATGTAPAGRRALAGPFLSPARAGAASQPGRLLRVAPYAAVAALIVLAFALFNLPGHVRDPAAGDGGSGPINKDTQLVGISMLASGTGWAIGEAHNGQAVLFHYTGGQWHAAALPSSLPAQAALHSIAMVSDSEGWAVGGVFAPGPAGGTERATATPLVTGPATGPLAGGTSVLLHDANGHWSVVQPTFAADLTTVMLRTASDGWAVGLSAGQEGMLLHYDGTTWRRVQSPAFEGVQLNGVSAVAANDVWLTGRLNDASSTILHFDGTSWQRQGGLDLSEAALSSIQMVSATEGWAAGGYCTCGHTLDVPPRMLSGALILHYSGGAWTFQTSSHPDFFLGDFLFDIAMVSPTEGWAVGEGSTIVHYSLGSWSPQASPSRLAPGATRASPSLLSISMVSATQGWAVGDQGTLLRFSNGDWEAF